MLQFFSRVFLTVGLVVFLFCFTVAQVGACPSAHIASIEDGFRYGFPPQVAKQLNFAGQHVSLDRPDIRYRILKELNYLLQDRRSRVLLWLQKADELKPVITPILRKYEVPSEFIFLAAIESSYNGRAMSSAGAYGFWQFIKSTAVCGPSGCDQYDWKMHINNWKDDRGDLVISTNSAAKYLAWMYRVKKVTLGDKPEQEGFRDWFLTAAAYNAGPGRVTQRLNGFGSVSYWDIPLPIETERYVPRWIAVGLIHKYRDYYGVQIPNSRTIAFDTIEKIRLQKDLPFASMARMLNSTPRSVWTLNSHIPAEKAVFPARSGKTPIEHCIHVPKGSRQKFLAQLAAHGYTKNGKEPAAPKAKNPQTKHAFNREQ